MSVTSSRPVVRAAAAGSGAARRLPALRAAGLYALAWSPVVVLYTAAIASMGSGLRPAIEGSLTSVLPAMLLGAPVLAMGRRLVARFGARAAMQVVTAPGQGFRVVVSLPVELARPRTGAHAAVPALPPMRWADASRVATEARA